MRNRQPNPPSCDWVYKPQGDSKTLVYTGAKMPGYQGHIPNRGDVISVSIHKHFHQERAPGGVSTSGTTAVATSPSASNGNNNNTSNDNNNRSVSRLALGKSYSNNFDLNNNNNNNNNNSAVKMTRSDRENLVCGSSVALNTQILQAQYIKQYGPVATASPVNNNNTSALASTLEKINNVYPGQEQKIDLSVNYLRSTRPHLSLNNVQQASRNNSQSFNTSMQQRSNPPSTAPSRMGNDNFNESLQAIALSRTRPLAASAALPSNATTNITTKTMKNRPSSASLDRQRATAAYVYEKQQAQLPNSSTTEYNTHMNRYDLTPEQVLFMKQIEDKQLGQSKKQELSTTFKYISETNLKQENAQNHLRTLKMIPRFYSPKAKNAVEWKHSISYAGHVPRSSHALFK